ADASRPSESGPYLRIGTVCGTSRKSKARLGSPDLGRSFAENTSGSGCHFTPCLGRQLIAVCGIDVGQFMQIGDCFAPETASILAGSLRDAVVVRTVWFYHRGRLIDSGASYMSKFYSVVPATGDK